MRNLIKWMCLIFLPLIIFSQTDDDWIRGSDIDTARFKGVDYVGKWIIPVYDKVNIIDPSNPNYYTYHVITSSATGETSEILGCKKVVDKNFCSLCHPEIQSEPILRPPYYEGGKFENLKGRYVPLIPTFGLQIQDAIHQKVLGCMVALGEKQIMILII